jgi:phage/plasmid primase-like uncharacterized protein
MPVEAVRVYAWQSDPEREGLFSAQVQKAGLWSHIEGKDGKPVLFDRMEDALALAERHLLAPAQAVENQRATPEVSRPLSPRQEFAQALAKSGLDLQGQEPVLDGEIHRVTLLPSANATIGMELGGAYCAYDGDPPYGWSQNFATGEKSPWIATGHVLSQEQIQAMYQEREENRLRAEAALVRVQNEAAREASELIFRLGIASKEHPYLKEREIMPFGAHQEQNTLYIPMQNIQGEIRNLQIIEGKDNSRFLIGAEREGLFNLIASPENTLPQGEIVLAENYASGASLHMATGKPVAVAFTAENLTPVAQALHQQFPQAAITICATNNQYERTDGTAQNRGVIEAERAAQAVGGKVVVPEFTDAEKSRSLVDFNDLHVSRGLEEVKRQCEGPALDKIQDRERTTEKKRNKAQDKGQSRGLGL